MAVGVLATGNHFVADVAAGVVLAVLVVPAADGLHRVLGRAGPAPGPRVDEEVPGTEVVAA